MNKCIKKHNEGEILYNIGRYISANTREGKWGTAAIKKISSWLRKEMPGLRGFGETNLKNMRAFYEAWKNLDYNSSVQTDELPYPSTKVSQATDNKDYTIRQFELTNLDEFPIVALANFIG